MKQENLYTSTQVSEIMDKEFEKFREKKMYGVFEHQAIREYIKQVKEILDKQQTNLA